MLPKGTELAYSAIPLIKSLQEPLRSEVRQAWAESTALIWQVMIGIAGLGLLCAFPMKALPLHTQVDEKWGLEMDEVPRIQEEVNQSTLETPSVLPL